MIKTYNISEEEYKDLIKMVKQEIYNYALMQGIDIPNTDNIYSVCKDVKKIKLGKRLTEYLLDGIMRYDVGDQRVLPFIDLEGVSFAGKKVNNVDFRGTNANIDPQTVFNKYLVGTILDGIDMSGKCFDECIINGAQLNYTNANINPQLVYNKDLSNTGCEGLDFSYQSFCDVAVVGASFKNAKIGRLNPQKVRNKDLDSTNLEGIDMNGEDFTGCNLTYCNLSNTNANIYLRDMDLDYMWGCNLTNTTVFVEEDFDEKELLKRLITIGKIKDSEYTKVKKRIRSIFNKANK